MQQANHFQTSAIGRRLVSHYGITLCVILLSMFVFPSCEKVVGKGPVVSELRTGPAFNGLSVRVDADVFFTIAPEYKIELRAQQNILNEMETEVVDDVLRIRFRPDTRIRSHERITIYVTAPQSRALELHGSGFLEATGKIEAQEMRLLLSGSARMRATEIECNKLTSELSGSGKIEVDAGSANEEKVRISGSGYVDLSTVVVKDAETWTSGSGDIRVHATETLKVNISGSGKVYYRGNPSIFTEISGSGSVVKM